MSDHDKFELSKTDSELLKFVHSGKQVSFKVFEEDILALASIIAGTSYQNLAETEKDLKIKESELTLKREPKNEHDEFAVAIYFQDKKLGYIPRSKNQTIARFMDAGKQFYAKITAKEWEGKWLRLDMEVYLKD